MPVLASCPILSQIWGWMLPITPGKKRQGWSISHTWVSISSVPFFNNHSPSTHSFFNNFIQVWKPSILKIFLFAILGSGETLCSLFPWIFHVLYKIGIFLPRTATQGGLGWVLDTGSTQWFHQGLKAHEQSYCTLLHFLLLQWNVSAFTGEWEGSNIFSWLPNFLWKRKSDLKTWWQHPVETTAWEEGRAGSWTKLHRGTLQSSTEQGQWHSFLGRGILQAPKASPWSQKCPQALTLISSTLSLSGTLAAPRAGIQTPGFSHQPWNLIFLAWITRQVEHFCFWPFRGRYWPKLQPGWKATLIKATLYKQGTAGEFFPGIHLDLVLGAVPEPKHWECCSPGGWSTLDLWVQPLRSSCCAYRESYINPVFNSLPADSLLLSSSAATDSLIPGNL